MEDTQNTNGTNGELKDPQNINEIDGDFVFGYCKKQGQEAVDWLKSVYATPPKKDKNGKLREISFIEVRNKFARKFFPHLVPTSKKPKKPTIKNKLDNL